MPVYLSRPPSNPLTRLLAGVVGALVLVGAFMVGMVAILVVLGVGLVAGAWLWFQQWRATRSGVARGPETPHRQQAGDTIEAEYTVISRDDDS